MYYFDMNFRKDMSIDHSDGHFVMPIYRDLVLDFRFGALSLNILFRVPWSRLLSCVSILRCYYSLSIWRDGNQWRSLKWYSITTCYKTKFLLIQWRYSGRLFACFLLDFWFLWPLLVNIMIYLVSSHLMSCSCCKMCIFHQCWRELQFLARIHNPKISGGIFTAFTLQCGCCAQRSVYVHVVILGKFLDKCHTPPRGWNMELYIAAVED